MPPFRPSPSRGSSFKHRRRAGARRSSSASRSHVPLVCHDREASARSNSLQRPSPVSWRRGVGCDQRRLPDRVGSRLEDEVVGQLRAPGEPRVRADAVGVPGVEFDDVLDPAPPAPATTSGQRSPSTRALAVTPEATSLKTIFAISSAPAPSHLPAEMLARSLPRPGMAGFDQSLVLDGASPFPNRALGGSTIWEKRITVTMSSSAILRP